MQARSACGDPARIALGARIKEVIVNITVEYLLPPAIARKAQTVAVIVKRVLIEAGDDHDVAAELRQPAMERDHAVVILAPLACGRSAAPAYSFLCEGAR